MSEPCTRFLALKNIKSVAGNMLVGSYCRFTNQGGVVHPGASLAELEELSSLLQVRFCKLIVVRFSRRSEGSARRGHSK